MQSLSILGLRFRGIMGALMLMLASAAAAQESAATLDAEAPFATVNDQVITAGEYARALRREARESFYHGQPPEGNMSRFQRKVADKLIEQTLLAQEARRRGLSPDADKVESRLERIEAGGADEQVLAFERERLERESLIEQLEARVKDLPSPSRDEVRAFYEANPELFTEPAKLKLSVILLPVDPGAGSPAWEAALEEARQLRERLVEGADFAEMARLHSTDSSADQGGDLGYVHKGMMAPEIEKATTDMAPGEISAPIVVLEGVTLVRFEDRRSPQLRDFAEVVERAEGLYMRERAEAAFESLRETLREESDIELREELLEPGGGNGPDSDQG